MSSTATEPFFYDPFSQVVQDDPYPFYKVLRDEHPVYHTPERGCWTLSRYADIQAAARDWHRYSNTRGVELDDVVDVYPDTFGPGIVINTDPPDHDRIRKVVHKTFTPRSVEELEPVVRRNVTELLDRLEQEPNPDLASGFAWQLPVMTTSDILGFPRSDHQMVLEWMLELEARDAAEAAAMPDSARAAAADLADYIKAQLADRRQTPRDDLLTLFVDAERAGALAAGEPRGLTFIFVLAGIDTTACLVSNTLHRMADRPSARAQLVESPHTIPAAVEEMIRFEAPVQGLARVALQDISVHDVTIPRGAWVWLAYASANRDERVFENPDELDFARTAKRHLGFGEGIHHCIGAPLARLEGRIAMELFFTRFPKYSIAGKGQRLHQHTTRGWVHLPAALQ